MLYEVDNAALVLEGDGLFFARTLVCEDNFETFVEECHCLQALHNGARNELGSFRSENGFVWPESNCGAVLATTCWSASCFCKLALWFTTVDKLHAPTIAITIDFEHNTARQSVHNADTYTVQTARDFVTLATELATGVKHCEHDFGRAFALVGARWVRIYWNSTAIVVDLAAAVFKKSDANASTEPSHCFIDGVVDNFPNEVMQTSKSSRADVHTGTFTNGI